ncbi:LuxR C-terminal-related transcriptional regulator [Nocardioides sp. QY071]|uniref:response regulator transcription factor n=1 Tax=Nocardioides sp. QY071 TaxID=3044187 RepID=UPI00249CD4F7|nr:LuxR C-terminal-related transcriptional regulator [Nocardioides sp. QY071]WGY04652.1 LuxR C-terminal-related transcriptional regulator [Nocardioides sp. QY071]
MKFDRLWERLFEYVNEWASAREVPGGIEVTFRTAQGVTRTVEVERQALVNEALQDQAEIHEIRARLERLTNRELDTLVALMTGAQVRDIARDRVVSEATVRTQVKNILSKLRTTSQLAAVGAAYRANWHPLTDRLTRFGSQQNHSQAG